MNQIKINTLGTKHTIEQTKAKKINAKKNHERDNIDQDYSIFDVIFTWLKMSYPSGSSLVVQNKNVPKFTKTDFFYFFE